MVSPFVKAYVYIDVWKHKRKIDGISDTLTQELSSFDYWKGKISYSWFWSAGVHVPNASAAIPGLILINAEWASRIVLNRDNPHMHDAFALTICHEITHQEKDFYYFDLFSADGKFVNWIDEVHADFGGVQKGLESNRSRALFAMKYKLSCKKKKDKDTRSHPSWNKRIDYILNYDFNEELIDKIAFDCGCSNNKVITAVKNFFDVIELRGEYNEVWY